MNRLKTLDSARDVIADNEGGTVFNDSDAEAIGVLFGRQVTYYGEAEFLLFADLMVAAATQIRQALPSVDATIVQMFAPRP